MKDLLAQDHRELDFLLTELRAALDGGDAPSIFSKLDFFWARLAMHIRAENLHLFPSILKAAPNDLKVSPALIREALRRLENDHNFFMRELGAGVKQMTELRGSGWRDARAQLDDLREKIDALSERLERHNELEESDVYLWAEALPPEAAAVLRAKIQKELDNLPPRFRRSA